MQQSSDEFQSRRKWSKIDTIAELGSASKTFSLDLEAASTGLYIAFQDGGSCSIIQQGLWFEFSHEPKKERPNVGSPKIYQTINQLNCRSTTVPALSRGLPSFHARSQLAASSMSVGSASGERSDRLSDLSITVGQMGTGVSTLNSASVWPASSLMTIKVNATVSLIRNDVHTKF